MAELTARSLLYLWHFLPRLARPERSAAGFYIQSETRVPNAAYRNLIARNCNGKIGLPDHTAKVDGFKLDPPKNYRAITRHTDGCIIHVRDIQAHSDREAIQIATARGRDIRTDLWSERGLVMRFGHDGI